jgi:hypothetical protein
VSAALRPELLQEGRSAMPARRVRPVSRPDALLFEASHDQNSLSEWDEGPDTDAVGSSSPTPTAAPGFTWTFIEP